jgi:hypothetical protein
MQPGSACVGCRRTLLELAEGRLRQHPSLIHTSVAMAPKISALGILLLVGGCCLSSIDGASSGGQTSGEQTSGAQTSGGQATGRGTSGGTADSGTSSTTGGDGGLDGGCTDTFCAPGYLCDPADGICRCGGQDCEGECAAGTCFVACAQDAGDGPNPILGGANAVWLPTAVVGMPYLYRFEALCDSSPLAWGGFLPPQLNLVMEANGELFGMPEQVASSGPFEFELWVTDSHGGFGVQNYLLEVVAPDGGT